MRILLVEDDHVIASVLRAGLKAARFTVDAAEDGNTGLELALAGPYALIILDLMLPGRDGWSICAALRERRITTPILILTARDAPEDRVRGLELGADDYLAKPFHFSELLARAHALIRRDQVCKTRLIRIADLEIDTLTGHVARAGQEISLTQREYLLLEALAANEGRVLSCRTLDEHLAGESDGGADSLAMDLETLREKIDDRHERKLIAAAGSVGYMLEDPDAVRPDLRETVTL